MIEWSEKFAVGNKLIDAQRQMLFGIINKLDGLIADRSHEGYEQFHIVLHELSEYARFHFETEERLLHQLDPMAMIQHIKEHNAYRERMCDVLFCATTGESDRRALHNYLAIS